MSNRRLVAIAATAAVLVLAGGLSVWFLTPRTDALPMVRLLEPGLGLDAPGAAGPVPVVAPGRSAPIHGVVLHSHTIAELRLGGRRLATRFADDRRAAEFSGYLDASDLRRDGLFEIEVVAVNGTRSVRRLPARRLDAAGAGAGGSPGFEEVAGSDRRQRWAVVIAPGTFDDPGIEPRPDAERQARALADLLRSPAAGLGGLPASHVRLVTGDDATARDIRSALTTFLRSATPDDLVMVFLAGRALPDAVRPDLTYLLARDTELDDIPATSVSLDFVRRAISDVYAANRVVLVDAGARFDRALIESAGARQGGLALVAAADADGFWPAVLDGLRGAADRDADGVVRLGELTGWLPGVEAATSYDRYWPLARVMAAEAVVEP